MTEENKVVQTAKKRGRPRKPKVSKQAENLFPDYVPSEERKNQLEHDVDDIFAEFAESEDLTSSSEDESHSEGREKSRNSSELVYAKRESVSDNTSDDINAEPHKTITSPKVEKEALNEFIRAEEIAADLVKAKGRFIEGVDNAKAGVTFRGPDASINPALLEGIEYNESSNPKQFIQKPKFPMRADGISFEKGVLDTGKGAQGEDSMPKVSDRDNPESESFMVCVNRECRYREHCMRYRLSNQRNMKTVFYPEDCRRDGIYMNIEETDFTAYDPMSVIESKSTPSF